MLSALEQFAPLPLQESWDNAGLQVGLTEAEVSGALLCLDVNERIVDEAIVKGCNLIVSHHPLLFRGLKQISGANDVQRTVIKAIKHDIVVVSMHTNMDNAMNGVNWKIAEHLGLKETAFFASKNVEDIECGSGVIGQLPEAMAADDFILLVKKQFDVDCQQGGYLWWSWRFPVGRRCKPGCRCLYHGRNALSPVLRLRTAHSDMCHRSLSERAIHQRDIPRHHSARMSRRENGNGRNLHESDLLFIIRNNVITK